MIDPGPGILLIADPFLKDPNFMRTVIFLCEHQEEGTFGFVLNRTYEHTLDELITSAENLKLPVYYGGPVQVDTIHFLHQYPAEIPGSTAVNNGVYWGGDFETAISLLRSGEIDPSKIRFYIGYSGWGGGQLDEELKEKSWLTAEANRRLVFHKEAQEIWKDAIRLLGGDYEMLINFPIDPQLN
ncbi:MAG: YqgE/AlgH family protein [Gemmatimonadaceae bacterium]|nr:YqgE/AlgH family protein [Chitinophagaceae bacterium]